MLRTKTEKKQRRHLRVRRKVAGASQYPRLVIRKTLKHLYAQVIDDTTDPKGSVALLQITTNTKANKSSGTKTFKNKEWGKKLGLEIARLAKEKGITQMVFDRAGYKYHGVVKMLCDSVREGGIKI